MFLCHYVKKNNIRKYRFVNNNVFNDLIKHTNLNPLFKIKYIFANIVYNATIILILYCYQRIT